MRTNKLILITLFSMSLFLYVFPMDMTYDNQKNVDLEKPDFRYDNYLNKFDRPLEILNRLNTNYTMYDGDKVTDLAFELEKSQIRFLNYYNDKIFYDDNHRKVYRYFQEGFSRKIIDEIEDTTFRELMLEIYNSNYRLKKNNDIYEVVIDYDLYKKYYSSMNTEGRSYFYIKEREIDRPYIIDGEFNIDLYDLGDRIVETDDFILKYPFSKRVNEMLYLNTSRIWDILIGDEVSKVIDENMIVKGNYRTLYRYLSSRISNKGLHKFLVSYIQLLENQEYRFDELASQYIHTYDDFYNYDIPMYDKERVIIEYLDGKKMGGDYHYPRIVGYSNKKLQEEFNEKLLEIIEERISYDGFKGYYMGEIDFYSNYEIAYNSDGIVCFKIFQNYEYKDFKRVEYLIRSMTVDLKNARQLTINDIFPNLANENDIIISRIEEFLKFSDEKDLINIDDFNNISNFEFVLNETSIDLLYNIFNSDNNFVRTIRIPINFDDLTVKVMN